jgi:AcrR family transcriptional regulator
MTTVTTQSRNRRRTRERRERMEAAALRLFCAQGIDGTTVQQITDAADVAKGTFFNYFGSKHDVLAKRLGRLAHEFLKFTERGGPEDPLLRLAQYFDSAEKRLREEGPQMLLLYREALVRPDLRNIDSETEDRILHYYSGLLSAGQGEGHLRSSFDPHMGAHLINDVWASTLRNWMSCAGSFGLADQLEKKIGLIFDGLRVPPA